MSNQFFDQYFDESQKTELPVGGDFTPTGLIGPMATARMYKFSSQTNLLDDEYKGKVQKPDYHWPSGDWHFYYYNKREDAVSAAAVAGNEDYGPQFRWLFQMSVDEIMNIVDLSKMKEAWGAMMTLESGISTYRSTKYRHEFHLINLPAAVAAAGKVLGYDVHYDLSELMNSKTDFTDDFRNEMIGPEDMTMEDVFKNTILGKRRAALWAALDEPNPMVYNSPTKDKADNKFTTHSEKLIMCLKPAEYRSKKKALVRMVSVPDPRVDAVNRKKQDDNGNPRRLLIPTIFEFFKTEEEAKAAAEEDKARQTANANKKAGGIGNEPALPAIWADLKAEWMSEIAEYVGKPLAPVLKSADYANLGCTKEELTAWLQFLNS